MTEQDLEVLHLDRRLVETVAATTQGYARYLAESQQQDDQLLSASTFTIAGSYWSLIDPVRAKSLYQLASRIYQRFNLSFQVVTAICAGDREVVGSYWSTQRETGFHLSTTEQLVHDLLATVWLMVVETIPMGEAREVLGMLIENAATTSSPAIGRLGIPLRHYVLFARAIDRVYVRQDDAEEQLSRVLTGFLHRADEAIEAAMADRFHWSRLLSGLLPVEPEAVAVCVVASIAARRALDYPLAPLVRVSPRQAVPLRIGEALVF